MYQAPLRPGGQPRRYEVLRADDRHWSEYVAGHLHNAGTPASPETKPVITVVRYGNTLLALPDEKTVERVERVIAKYQPEPHLPGWMHQDPQKGEPHITLSFATEPFLLCLSVRPFTPHE